MLKMAIKLYYYIEKSTWIQWICPFLIASNYFISPCNPFHFIHFPYFAFGSVFLFASRPKHRVSERNKWRTRLHGDVCRQLCCGFCFLLWPQVAETQSPASQWLVPSRLRLSGRVVSLTSQPKYLPTAYTDGLARFKGGSQHGFI